MTKKELRKEFLEIDGDTIEQSQEKTFDWFYSKLKESNDAGSKLSSQVIDLEMIVKAKEEKIKSMHDEIDTAVRLYAESQAKLKAADDVISSMPFIGMTEYTLKALEHYKSLKP